MLALLPPRWKLRTRHLSVELVASPIERLCHHGVWIRRQDGELVCRQCGKESRDPS